MKNAQTKAVEARSEARTFLDAYRSVEFSISRQDPVLQFRIRDLSPSGMGILMNKASKALAYLRVGQLIDMTYNPENGKGTPENMKTEIRHITYLEAARSKDNIWWDCASKTNRYEIPFGKKH